MRGIGLCTRMFRGLALRALPIGMVFAWSTGAWSADSGSLTCDSSRPRESVTVAFSEERDAQRVVFAPSDDGTLRATDAGDGRQLWTYRPKEAAESTTTGSRITDIRVLRFDARRDGVIDISDGDRVWLYFGVRGAGTAYYALDVTDPSVARVLWHVTAAELPGAGESWSTPTLARVKVAGEGQNGEHFVLILGGGYDTRANTSGNRLFMLDAATGHLLWSAAGAGAGTTGASGGATAGDSTAGTAGGETIGSEATFTPDLVLPSMRFPIPARVAAIDTDGDAFADRFYAADLGGQVWRFDIGNGRTRGSLVTGGVFASLGGADSASSTANTLPTGADARRFFNAPDVALIQQIGADPYYNLALGSGDAAALNDPSLAASSASIHDRFYSLRDRNAFNALSQQTYDATPPVLDSDLLDITDAPLDSPVPPEAPGWKLDLRGTDSASGERVLAGSLTVNGVILFTTFQATATGCASDGSARVYAVKVDTAQPALDLNNDGKLTADDRSIPLNTPGVPASPEIELMPPISEGAVGSPPTPPAAGKDDNAPRESTRCRVGEETLAHCVPFRALIRTFWRRHSTL